MKKLQITLIALILLACLPFGIAAEGSSGDGEEQTEIPSLAEVYKDYFRIGNIMSPAQLTQNKISSHFLHHYNSVTAENAMKPEIVAAQKDSINFIVPDLIVNWALENNVEAHGHTLVWHQQSPDWFTKDDDGNPLTRLDAKANMENFITGYTSHFTGRVSSWDVVNEAFTDSVNPGTPWRNGLRKDSPWYQAYANGMDESAGEAPEDYIYDAFVFARLAAPDAMLFYNDFNDDEPGKREAIAAMVEELNSKWLDDERNSDKGRMLIEVIGMQAHYWTDTLSLDNVRASIERYISTGAKVAVTELDIAVGSYTGFRQVSEEDLEEQAMLYKGLFEIYIDYCEHFVRVTFWGKADHQSWRSAGSPLLFDSLLQPKAAYWEVVELADGSASGFPAWGFIAVGSALIVLAVILGIRAKKKQQNNL